MSTMSFAIAGALTVVPALDAAELLAEPVAATLRALPADLAAHCGVAEIDPALADTAALCAHYDLPLSASANCVVVTGKRAGIARWAACVVLATTRADVNGATRRRLDVRKASFAAQDEAVAATGMEYGGITPIGIPGGWPILLDQVVAESAELIIGSGIRRSKVLLPGSVLAALPGAEVLAGLGT
jgi:prolyl-tRNA editing enzyme YbaK/EbsC (Cys-tRNA(Pro) deacylase)